MIYADLMGTMVNVGFPRDDSPRPRNSCDLTDPRGIRGSVPLIDDAIVKEGIDVGRYSADDLWKRGSLTARICNLYEDNRAFPILARSKLLVN
jgi:hypothetical protein